MKGYSLHIGVDLADTNHYPGILPLQAAVNDARWWKTFAQQQGYQTKHLHNEQATIQAVRDQLLEYSQTMVPGDILLLTYSGHGGELFNEKPDSIDREKMDQTWCLYNEEMLDDELYEAFGQFVEGTRIVVVADSCHSGTITRAAENDLSKWLEEGMSLQKQSAGRASRQLPQDVQQRVINRSYEKVYAPKIKKFKRVNKRSVVKAAVKLLAACQDNQVTYDGEQNGIFTDALRLLLEGAAKPQTAEELIAAVKKVYVYPRPNFFQYGAIIPSFDTSSPFQIDIPDAAKTAGNRKPKLIAGNTGREATDFSSGDIDRNAVLVADIKGQQLDKIAGGADIIILQNKQTARGQQLMLEIKGVPYSKGWSAAHALQAKLKKDGLEATIEPVLSFNPDPYNGKARASSGNEGYMPEWSPANVNPNVKIGWHLDDDHSGLAKAAQRVMDKPGTRVRIGHVDTGYLKNHIGLPKNLLVDQARSFVSGEKENQAIDAPNSGMDGHGTGTIGILAGNNIPLSATYDEFTGWIGGAPMAEVVPIRISDSVIIWNSSTFCDAIDYALQAKCEVITMSMAGKPSPAMAEAVNRAYEEGMVIVSAASNCWYKGAMQAAPKCVLWPAAFERVIAATGAMYNHQPYDGDFLLQSKADFTKYMQGCWGPPSRMKKALAAYTPNTPWASKGDIFVRSGGGTSSATPQIAAAAALWIAYHREEMEEAGFYEPGNKWKIVEAVRVALFSTAAKGEVFRQWKQYYGNGILRAGKALDVPLKDVGKLRRSAEAESSFGGFFQILGAFFLNRRLFRDAAAVKPTEEALSLELLHLLQTDPAFYETFSNLDLDDPAQIQKLLDDPDFTTKVIASPYASDYLKQAVAR